jgi:ketosteroid isomerase-like protein
MAESNVAVVRRLFEHFSDGQLEAAIELLSDDFVVVIPPSLSAEPDVYEGHDGARRYFAGFEGLMDDVRYDLLEVIEEDDVVIVGLVLAGRGVASGIEVEQHAAAVAWVENGKITRIEAYPDLEAARASLRRTPQADW